LLRNTCPSHFLSSKINKENGELYFALLDRLTIRSVQCFRPGVFASFGIQKKSFGSWKKEQNQPFRLADMRAPRLFGIQPQNKMH
jgi:hypothetical protein